MHYRPPRPLTPYQAFSHRAGQRGAGKAPALTGPLALYAILAAAEAPLLARKGQILPALKPAQIHPPLAADPEEATAQQPAALCALWGPAVAAEASTVLRHDRVVCGAHRRCSGVVPFRFGVTVPSLAVVDDLLRDHHAPLLRVLARLRNRVEVGLKLRPVGDALPRRLAAIRALARSPQRRREHLGVDSNGSLFSAAYLIARLDLQRFWLALEDMRHEIAGQPLIGSGPHAPYSFCDVTLAPGEPGRSAPQLLFAAMDLEPPPPPPPTHDSAEESTP